MYSFIEKHYYIALDDSKTLLSLETYNIGLRKDLGMKYSIEFKTDYCSMTEKELNSLAQEFKENWGVRANSSSRLVAATTLSFSNLALR